MPAPTRVALATANNENAAYETKMPPALIESNPPAGSTGVSTELTEIRITFDADMQRGMS